MQAKFTTSVNIIRDKGRELRYISTPNGIQIVNQISNDFKKGLRSFNIIGSYGTGKSSFIWALQNSLNTKNKYFNLNLISNQKVDFINIIGEYRSIKDAFAQVFEVKVNKNLSESIFSEIYNRFHDLGRKNGVLFLVIDEFGKFLEYAAQNEPEKELYFIQQLAEFVNNSDNNIVLLTAVHQNFDAYGFSLSQSQKQEWTKVKGRFRELTFNEPVEQLLFLASEYLVTNQEISVNTATIKKTTDFIVKSKLFDINESNAVDLFQKLYPLDVASAFVLALSIQKYGQNERSLFSFLESTDHTGLSYHINQSKDYYTIADVYDYLVYNFYSFLNSRYNPDFSSFKGIKSAIEKVETTFDANVPAYIKLVKTIGLLNINAKSGGSIDKAFLVGYFDKCCKINEIGNFIDDLKQKNIITYRNFSKRYVLTEGSDLDISIELEKAGNTLDTVDDVVTLLNKYFQLPPAFAKKILYETGTPRLFEYRITADPISLVPYGDTDGFINLIFNDKLKVNDIKEHSLNTQEAILFCFHKNAKSIKEIIFEIEKTKKVITENQDDKVAIRELNNILIHQQNLLSHKILNNFYGDKSELLWFFKGEQIKLNSKKQFNNYLSDICESVYSSTPKFNNELVNKHKISTSIHTAKKLYFKALINDWDKPNLGFPKDKFPAEKTIYLSLLENNNIKLYSDSPSYKIKPNGNNKFDELWKESVRFISSAKKSKRNLSDFISSLSKRPFKLKQGLIDFWVPTFLFIKRDEFALFDGNGYIPSITDDIMDLIGKNPSHYEIKSYDIEGVRLEVFNNYRNFLNQDSKENISSASFIETIKPFLSFYKSLSDYSKNTNRISKQAIAIREAIAKSKDPEHTFFEDFPSALGTSITSLNKNPKLIKTYMTSLQDAVREIRTSHDELISRIEFFIVTEIIGGRMDYEDYKSNLQSRYDKLKKHLLMPQQRVFMQRLDSQIDDHKAWINSLVQALINTSTEKITDQDEIVIYDKFKSMIEELDSLTNISRADIKEEKENVFDLQINSFFDGISKKLVRLPKSKTVEINKIQGDVKKKLSSDNTLNIAALTNLLKEMLKK